MGLLFVSLHSELPDLEFLDQNVAKFAKNYENEKITLENPNCFQDPLSNLIKLESNYYFFFLKQTRLEIF